MRVSQVSRRLLSFPNLEQSINQYLIKINLIFMVDGKQYDYTVNKNKHNRSNLPERCNLVYKRNSQDFHQCGVYLHLSRRVGGVTREGHKTCQLTSSLLLIYLTTGHVNCALGVIMSFNKPDCSVVLTCRSAGEHLPVLQHQGDGLHLYRGGPGVLDVVEHCLSNTVPLTQLNTTTTCLTAITQLQIATTVSLSCLTEIKMKFSHIKILELIKSYTYLMTVIISNRTYWHRTNLLPMSPSITCIYVVQI